MEKSVLKVVKVMELPVAFNVCNQTLREVVQTPSFSVAHVIMEPGARSILHKHESFSELYYILRGKGVLYSGSKAYNVARGSYVVIPPNTPHMLHNDDQRLAHLVLASPPFNPKDVILMENDDYVKSPPKKFLRRIPTIVAQDGATIKELLTEEEIKITGISLALGGLDKGRKAVMHRHEEAEEVYYIVGGKGKVTIGKLTQDISPDTVAYVPRGTNHSLENLSTDSKLTVLCISSPPYKDKDFIPVTKVASSNP